VDAGGGNDLWHYAVGSERKGPVPRTTIAKLLASGEISAETYVWQPGMDNWVHLVDAPPLKALVAGLEGDGQPEEFVEEDTAFTSPADLKAVHTALDDDDEELSGDTIVESIPVVQPAKSAPVVAETGPRGTARQPKGNKGGGNTIMGTPAAAQAAAAQATAAQADKAKAAAPAKAEAAKPTTSMGAVAAPATNLAKPAVAEPVAAKPAAKNDSGVYAAAASPAASAAADIFGGGPEDDIFGGSEPTSEAEDIAGVHGRRQSSVLFSLDELGREEGKKGAGGKGSGGNEQFVTDSSGLIDIKAIATNEKGRGDHDPFGASAPNLVLAPRNSPAAMTVPIVERKRGNGPWILAAAALLLIGGGIVAFILVNGKDPVPVVAPVVATEPAKTEPVVAKVEPPKTEPPKTEPAKTEPVKDPANNGQVPPTNPEVTKVEPPANPVANPVVDPVNPGTAEVKKDEKPKTEVKKDEKPKTEVKKDEKPKDEKPKDEKPKDEKPKDVVVKVEEKPKDPNANAKVNDLLSKLNNGEKTENKDPVSNDSALPDKLSAATVRNQIKGRFGRCGSMISNPSGSVTVQTQFVISSSGVVQSARVSDGGGTSPDVQRCVVQVIKETSFGKFKEPTMQVNLPVRLL